MNKFLYQRSRQSTHFDSV